MWLVLLCIYAYVCKSSMASSVQAGNPRHLNKISEVIQRIVIWIIQGLCEYSGQIAVRTNSTHCHLNYLKLYNGRITTSCIMWPVDDMYRLGSGNTISKAIILYYINYYAK